jgi:hypothetical protein
MQLLSIPLREDRARRGRGVYIAAPKPHVAQPEAFQSAARKPRRLLLPVALKPRAARTRGLSVWLSSAFFNGQNFEDIGSENLGFKNLGY